MNKTRMADQLLLHEGLRLKPYKDTAEEPNWTLGVGYNVTARGLAFFEHVIGRKLNWVIGAPCPKNLITKDEALAVLAADIDRVEKAVRTYFPTYDLLDEVRQRVCVDMAFNIGYSALKFKATIAAVKARDWSTAAKQLYRSKWATQVGDGEGGRFDRADRLVQMMLTGKDYTV